MISMATFRDGLYITLLGITVVFTILSILAIILYAVGWIERRLVEKESGVRRLPMIKKAPTGGKKAVTTEAPKTPEPTGPEGVPPHELAVITASILAYMARKAEELKPVPIKRKVSDSWRIHEGGWYE